MTRSAAGLMVLVALMLVAGGTAAGMSGRWTPAPSQVYTVAQLHAHLANDPQAWVNRQVVVRAIAGGCIPWAAPKDEPCVDEQPALVQMGPAGLVSSLPLVCGVLPSLSRTLRKVALLRRWLPAPQILQPGKLMIYRIQLPAVPAGDVLLIDSLPSCGAA